MALILANGRLFDGVSDVVRERAFVFVEGDRIREVSDRPFAGSDAPVLDLGGRFVMPGLIDAHFHAYGSDLNPATIDRQAPALRALHARRILEDALMRGFTSLRDAAGGDAALAAGLRLRLIKGPRLFYPGLALSQTGGHGDMRAPDHFDGCACGYCGSLSVIADGPDEMRKLVREQLRQGASQIKLFVSGGVLSPSDPIWMNQFCEAEIRVAVEEAATRRAYVMAHAHTNEAAIRCVRNGVRTIEHATLLEADGAREIAAHDAFAVPTLAIMDGIKRSGARLGLPQASLDKLAEVERHALTAIDHLRQAGAKIGFGTDLLGELMPLQSSEFSLRRQVCEPIEILKQATSVNAAILKKDGELGVIADGALADILVVDGDPLADIAVLEDPARLAVIIREGELCKNALA
ncbi:MAG: amidohydrolase family protein [Caulobacteraceae bacterium]|nr:amidohydrolase family protein [Caulobacteraceae bacterium]